MSARERILSRLRARTDVDPAARKAATDIRAGGAAVPASAVLSGDAALAQFKFKLQAVDASISEITSLDALPAALAEELRARNLPARIRHGADPFFQSLDWGTIEASAGTGRIEEPATLSRAEMGLAETGTLVLYSGPDNPVTLTFLGETHFVVLRRDGIVGGMEQLWPALRSMQAPPRTVNLVTGPSRSADIGQKLQLGAHGPVALHVFVVG